MEGIQDSQWQLWLPVERKRSHHMQPFLRDKSENFEQVWAGETEAGRVLGIWGSPIHGRVSHSQFSHRLCHWLLPKLLTRLFLSVQLHWGQLEMVLRAARTVWSPARAWPGTLSPWNAGNSPQDPLLAAQGAAGVPVQPPVPGGWATPVLCPPFPGDWAAQGDGGHLAQPLPPVRQRCEMFPEDPRGCSICPRCSSLSRSLLQRLGGIFLPSGMARTLSDRDEGLPGAVLDAVSAVWAEKSLWST